MGITDRKIGSGPKSPPCSHLRSVETIDRPRPDLMAQADSSRSLSFAFGTALPAPLRPLTGPARNGVHRWKAAVPDLPGHAVRAVIYLLKTRPPRLGHRRQTETVVMTLSQASTGPGLPALHGASTLAAATARRFRRYREPGGGWPLRPAPGRRVPPLGPSAG